MHSQRAARSFVRGLEIRLKKALKESNYSLKDMLIDGRKSETCSAQARAWKKKLRMYNLIKLRENLLNLSAITVDLLTLIWIVLVRPQIQLVTRVAYLVISLECVERKNASFFQATNSTRIASTTRTTKRAV